MQAHLPADQKIGKSAFDDLKTECHFDFMRVQVLHAAVLPLIVTTFGTTVVMIRASSRRKRLHREASPLREERTLVFAERNELVAFPDYFMCFFA